MNYPIVDYINDDGELDTAYRVELPQGIAVLVNQYSVDSGETTIEAEVALALEGLVHV